MSDSRSFFAIFIFFLHQQFINHMSFFVLTEVDWNLWYLRNFLLKKLVNLLEKWLMKLEEYFYNIRVNIETFKVQ